MAHNHPHRPKCHDPKVKRHLAQRYHHCHHRTRDRTNYKPTFKHHKMVSMTLNVIGARMSFTLSPARKAHPVTVRRIRFHRMCVYRTQVVASAKTMCTPAIKRILCAFTLNKTVRAPHQRLAPNTTLKSSQIPIFLPRTIRKTIQIVWIQTILKRMPPTQWAKPISKSDPNWCHTPIFKIESLNLNA